MGDLVDEDGVAVLGTRNQKRHENAHERDSAKEHGREAGANQMKTGVMRATFFLSILGDVPPLIWE